MARGQRPLACAQGRAAASTPAASPETSVAMAPPAASPETDGGSPSRPPLAGVAEASAPSSLPTASTEDASGEGSESSLPQPDDALSPSLDYAYAARQLVATNIALEQSSQAAEVLEQRCRRLDKSLADTHKVIRQDRGQFKAGIASYAAQLRQLREYLEQSDRPSSVSRGTSSASASAMPAAFSTFLEELGSLQLVIPPPPSASGSSEASVPAPPASSGISGGAGATSGSSTSLTVDSNTSDDSGPIIPSALNQGKRKRPAKLSAKLQSAPSPPKKKQRLSRPSVDLKARKAAKQTASAAVSSSGPSQSVPSSLSAASVSTWSVPVSGSAVSADREVLSFARITPGTEASVLVETGDDGGSGTDGAASETSVAPGAVFSFPVVSPPRRDGRPTRAASAAAGLRSMAAAENEAAPDALVMGLATTSRTPAAI
ncbi:unnamed protein product [Phytophthora fragariaefolia]|uniref:Unnamed protein product n=1 Tax=Phytophthora fragariaefolia TaxID=1490495 RepID=A0A9W6TUB3_9STRA|nr:unnamed protein product [Phytophthora fragariaefolia]